jgi:hypothetical protein
MSTEDRKSLEAYSEQELKDTLARFYAELEVSGDRRRYDGVWEGRPCVQLSSWSAEGVCPFPGCLVTSKGVSRQKHHCVYGHSAPFSGIELIRVRRRQGQHAAPLENNYIEELRRKLL